MKLFASFRASRKRKQGKRRAAIWIAVWAERLLLE